MDGALATCPLPLILRETWGADVSFCTATAEPGPGARAPGAPGCASAWKVSDECGEHFFYTHCISKPCSGAWHVVDTRALVITLRAFGSEFSGGQRKGLAFSGGLHYNPGIAVGL